MIQAYAGPFVANEEFQWEILSEKWHRIEFTDDLGIAGSVTTRSSFSWKSHPKKWTNNFTGEFKLSSIPIRFDFHATQNTPY